jgi:predicted ArsR family transcriptional regulator
MAGRKETVSDAEILRFFEESSDPFLTTVEVAEFLGFSNEGARKRLYDLADEGLIDFKRVGRSPAWWITNSGRELIDAQD